MYSGDGKLLCVCVVVSYRQKIQQDAARTREREREREKTERQGKSDSIATPIGAPSLSIGLSHNSILFW